MYAADHPYCSTRFAAMAHRGGPKWQPNLGIENTARAFAQVVELGYRYLETDVRATRDGRLVCFHDETLERMTGIEARVADCTAADLAGVKVAGSEPIPFFDEIVAAFPDARFNVDLKSDDAVAPLVKTIESHRLQDRVLVNSFSQLRLSLFRSLTYGSIPTGMAAPGILWTRLVPLVSTIISSPAVALQVPLRDRLGPFDLTVVTRTTIARAHRLGKVVHVWTIDDPTQMEWLIDLGVDGIITDRPDLLKDILIARDLWDG